MNGAERMPSTASQGELEREVKMLREMVRQNHELLQSMRRQMRISSVFSVLRLVILLIPLILALIYLPPFLREAFQYYKDFTSTPGLLNTNGGLDLTEWQNLLQSTGFFER